METADGKRGRSAGKRRYRTVAEKLEIVQETLAAEVSVAVVARRHGVNANQLFHWRKQYHSGLLVLPAVETVTDESRLLPVAITEEAAPEEGLEATTPKSSTGTIHIELPGVRWSAWKVVRRRR
jgi:transposase